MSNTTKPQDPVFVELVRQAAPTKKAGFKTLRSFTEDYWLNSFPLASAYPPPLTNYLNSDAIFILEAGSLVKLVNSSIGRTHLKMNPEEINLLVNVIRLMERHTNPPQDTKRTIYNQMVSHIHNKWGKL